MHYLVGRGHWPSGSGADLGDHLVGVEVDLPVVIVIAVGPHADQATSGVEFDDLDLRRRIDDDVGDLRYALPKARDLSD